MAELPAVNRADAGSSPASEANTMTVTLFDAANAWYDVLKRREDRERRQTIRLVDWQRQRNGQWINKVSWSDAHPRTWGTMNFYHQFKIS